VRTLVALLVLSGVLMSACGGGGEPLVELPGSGTSIAMARADWDTGYFQAAVYRALLEELGYEVSDPSEAEMAPDQFYPALAVGEFDFWANGWFPVHDTFLTVEVDGAPVSDGVVVVGNSVPAGGLQGFLIDAATASEFGIKRLDDIGNDAATAAIFDRDGDGVADLVGCNEGWGCHEVIEATLAANGWEDTISQESGDYNELWDDTVARYEAGQPILAYTWSPSAYIVELVAGKDVVWVSLESPLPATPSSYP
jgi:glycine betaine/proline transport system substrate-binding protein